MRIISYKKKMMRFSPPEVKTRKVIVKFCCVRPMRLFMNYSLYELSIESPLDLSNKTDRSCAFGPTQHPGQSLQLGGAPLPPTATGLPPWLTQSHQHTSGPHWHRPVGRGGCSRPGQGGAGLPPPMKPGGRGGEGSTPGGVSMWANPPGKK